MDKQLLKRTFKGGSFEIDIAGGNVVVAIAYDHPDFIGSASFTLKTLAGLDQLKAMIPGSIDDVIIDVIKGVLAA